MEALKREIYIPEDHHIHFDFKLPEVIPAGKTEVLMVFQPLSSDSPKCLKSKILDEMFSSDKITLDVDYKFDREECHDR